MTLTKADKSVIRAFTEHRAASSKHLSTDGQTLSGNYMGGHGMATWSGGKIHFHDLGSSAAQTVQRAVAKEAPSNWLARNPSGAKQRAKGSRHYGQTYHSRIGEWRQDEPAFDPLLSNLELRKDLAQMKAEGHRLNLSAAYKSQRSNPEAYPTGQTVGKYAKKGARAIGRGAHKAAKATKHFFQGAYEGWKSANPANLADRAAASRLEMEIGKTQHAAFQAGAYVDPVSHRVIASNARAAGLLEKADRLLAELKTQHPAHFSRLKRTSVYRNPAPKAGNAAEASELVLFTENDYYLWERRMPQYAKNLATKMKRGKYDATKAVKLLEYLAGEAAQKYVKQFGGAFSPATRRMAAQQMLPSVLERAQYL